MQFLTLYIHDITFKIIAIRVRLYNNKKTQAILFLF